MTYRTIDATTNPPTVLVYCLSTETKPTGDNIGNGSHLMQTDDGKTFVYNAETEEWTEGAIL